MNVKCPHCDKSVVWNPENIYRPFCSQRCKLIDFGAWAKEEHVITGNSEFDDYMPENTDTPFPANDL